jgi:hypothetical protein
MIEFIYIHNETGDRNLGFCLEEHFYRFERTDDYCKLTAENRKCHKVEHQINNIKNWYVIFDEVLNVAVAIVQVKDMLRCVSIFDEDIVTDDYHPNGRKVILDRFTKIHFDTYQEAKHFADNI